MPTQLFMAHCWNRPNVYGKDAGVPTPWEPNMGKGKWPWVNVTWGCWDVHSSVAPEASSAFWHERFEQQVNDSNLQAAILDQLSCLQNSFAGWVNRTDAVSQVQQGYDDAATFHKIPYRVDLHSPSDVLASLTGSAWVTSRANGDATPAMPPGVPAGSGDTRDSIIGSSTLLSALGVRPMMNVMWTVPVQPGDPYNCNSPDNCARLNDVTNMSIWSIRQNIQRDLLVATLSAGPVGIGDMVGGTDTQMLRAVLNEESIILKPAHPFLRMNRYYTGDTDSVFTAVGVPARSSSAAIDRRANSMSRLLPLGSVAELPDALWWHMLLTTENAPGPNLKSVSVSELWPTPSPTAVFLATWAFGWPGTAPAAKCTHGAKPDVCLTLVDQAHPLPIATPKAISQVPRNNTLAFRHLVLAPVLASGWVLIGELEKFVPVSPQRFVVHDNSSKTVDTASDACRPQEVMVSGKGLAFAVLGSPGEIVTVTVVAPALAYEIKETKAARAMAGTLLVLGVAIGADGRADVVCGKDDKPQCELPAAA